MYIKIGNDVFEAGSNFEGTIDELAEAKRIELGAESYELIDPAFYSTVEMQKSAIIKEILQLESKISLRRMVEAVTSDSGKQWLVDIQNSIESKRLALRMLT